METINEYKKRVERHWIQDFETGTIFDDMISEDSYIHRRLGKVSSPKDFWDFYLLVKRDKSPVLPVKLTVFQLTKAYQFFSTYLGDPSIHWFFIQAIKALEHDLYIPACSAILNGVEASLRRTVHQMEKDEDEMVLSPYQVLSNSLVSKAREFGLPTEALAFPNETNFEFKLLSRKSDRIDIEIVRVRNNICHGNILEYISEVPNGGHSFLTPECLRDLAWNLVDVSRTWVYELGLFRMEQEFHKYFPRAKNGLPA